MKFLFVLAQLGAAIVGLLLKQNVLC